MDPQLPVGFDLEAYAVVLTDLSHGQDRRAEVLAAHKIDEETWTVVDTHFQAQLSTAMSQDSDEVPPIIQAWSQAMAKAQSRPAPGSNVEQPPMSVEKFAEATHVLSSSGDPAKLTHLGLTLGEFLAANIYWVKRFPKDPEAAARFTEVLTKR